MNRWRPLFALYRRELRCSLRERTILVSSVLIPIFLYPTLIWLIFTGVTFVQGQVEGLRGRVLLRDGGKLPALRERILAAEDLEIVEVAGGGTPQEQLRSGRVDAVLSVGAPAPGARSPALVLEYDGARDRSRMAKTRLEEIVGRLRADAAADRARRAGVPDRDWVLFAVERRNAATGRQMGAYLLGMMLPLLVVIIVAVGTMAPAVDATAGERERSTWETTLTLAVPRWQVAAAKYLHVATLGALAGLLNVAAMVASMRFMLAPILGSRTADFRFSLSPGTVLLFAAGIVAVSLLLAALMMLAASAARTFREGQSMVVPLYLLTVLPLLLLQDPDIRLDLRWAAVPVVGVLLMLRDALNGVFSWPAIAAAVGVQGAAIALCLLAASRIIGREDFLLGAPGRSPASLLRRVLRRGRPTEAGRG